MVFMDFSRDDDGGSIAHARGRRAPVVVGAA
jgi:hypothetical protein